MRQAELEAQAAKERREKREREEARRTAYKEQVFAEHEVTSAYSTQSSFQARQVRKKISRTIRENKELIPKFDRAVEKFNRVCSKVINKENYRIEMERQHAEAVQANAGKELDFFQEPTLLTRERFGLNGQRIKTASYRVKKRQNSLAPRAFRHMGTTESKWNL